MLGAIARRAFVLRAWILSLAFLTIVVWIVESSKPFQSCVENEYQKSAAQNFDRSISELTRAFVVYRDCVGHFTHDNAEAIIAAFTILLALATIFLWAATRDLVREGRETRERQLRAYMGMENNGTKFIEASEEIKLFFKNYGNTPATKVSMWVKIIEGTEEHSDFGYTDGTWVARNQITHPGQLFGQVVGKVGEKSGGFHIFFIYDYVVYEDAFENRWRYCFAYAHDISRRGDAWRCYHKHNYEEPENSRTGAPLPA
jgi:hypothetical protein